MATWKGNGKVTGTVKRLLALVGLLSACGPALVALPTAPAVQTVAGRQCIQQCQAIYNDCGVGALSASIGRVPVWETIAVKREATNACRQNLAGCYGTCP
jgi:hypothetical protein